MLGAGYYCHDITWWENTDGTGTTWTEHTLDGSFDGARSVYSTDVDGDGYADVLGAGYLCDNITWWDVVDGYSTGTIESSILDIEHLPEWDSVSWTSTEPAGTSVGVQLRSSENYSMGAWSDTIFTSGASLTEILEDSTRYVQYRLILYPDAQRLYTPEIEDISLTYLELISILSPMQYSIWTHGYENQLVAWQYELSDRYLQGDSVSIDLFKSDSFIADLTGGKVANTGNFTYPGPVPSEWVPGTDYHIVVTDDLDNYGCSDLFEIMPGVGNAEQSTEPVLFPALLPFSPNPVSGTASALVVMPESGEVSLSVYDTSGRIVRSSTTGQSAGTHSVSFGELSCGIYFCRMETANYSGTEMFAVVK